MNKLLALSVVVMLVGCKGVGDKILGYNSEGTNFERPNVKLHSPPIRSDGTALTLYPPYDYADWHNEKQWEKINELEARIDLLLKKIEADK